MKKTIIALGAIYIATNAGETDQKVIQFDIDGDKDFIVCRSSNVLPGMDQESTDEVIQTAKDLIHSSGKKIILEAPYEEAVSGLMHLGFDQERATSLLIGSKTEQGAIGNPANTPASEQGAIGNPANTPASDSNPAGTFDPSASAADDHKAEPGNTHGFGPDRMGRSSL